MRLFFSLSDGTDVVQIWLINALCMYRWHAHVSRFCPRSSVSGVQSLTTQCTRRIRRVSSLLRFQCRCDQSGSAMNEYDRLPPARKQWQDNLRGEKAQPQWQDDLQGPTAAPPRYEQQYGSSNAIPMRSEAGYPVGSEFTIASRHGRI